MKGVGALVRGAVLSAASVCVSMAALLVTGKMFTNALDRETVGVFSLFLIASDFIIIASGLGLSVSMPKLVAEASEARRRLVVGSALTGQLGVLLIASAAVVLCRLFASAATAIELPPDWRGLIDHLHWLPLLFVVGGLRDLIMAMLAGLDRYGHRAVGMTAASLAQVALVYALVWRLGGGLTALILAMTASYALALAWLWLSLGACAAPVLNLSAYLRAVRFSVPLYANQLFNFLHQRFDSVLIALLLGFSHAAVYEMVKRLPVILTRVIGALLVPYLPRLSRLIAEEDFPSAASLLNHTARLAVFVGGAVVVSAIAVQEFMVVALFNREYLSGAPVIGLLMIAACLQLQAGIMGQSLIALGRGAAVPIVNILAVSLSIAGNLLVVRPLGLVGVGWIAIVSSALSCGLQAAWVHRCGLRIKFHSAFTPLVLLFACALTAAQQAPWSPGRLLMPVVYALCGFAFGVITPAQAIALGRALLPGGKRS